MTGAMWPRPRFRCTCGRNIATVAGKPDEVGRFLLRWHRDPITGQACGGGYRYVEATSDRRVSG